MGVPSTTATDAAAALRLYRGQLDLDKQGGIIVDSNFKVGED